MYGTAMETIHCMGATDPQSLVCIWKESCPWWLK